MAKTSKKAVATRKPDTVTIKVTDFHTSAPLVLHVNAQKFRFPIGEEVTAPKHVEAAMASVSGVTYETSESK